MEKRRFSRETYAGVRERVSGAGGDTSFAGRQHIKETKKLHPLVDPAGYGLVRRSLPRYSELADGRLLLPNGIPMLDETLFDTTGSMGGNVALAFESLPTMYDLLTAGDCPVFGRYDPQIINAIFGDVVDRFVCARSQAEMDEKIPEQLTLMVPEYAGGDGSEDPEYGLFGAAFLTDAFINRYGLKRYHSLVTDADSHGRIDKSNLIRVFGDTVFDVVKENGHSVTAKDLPTTKEIVDELKKRAHAFMIQVGDSSNVGRYWSEIYGVDHFVVIESTKYLPFVKAAIIGLTEGVFDLQFVSQYLESVGCAKGVAKSIQRAVAGIPLGAQVILPNFGKIPKKGSMFAKKQDLWPIADNASVVEEETNDVNWL